MRPKYHQTIQKVNLSAMTYVWGGGGVREPSFAVCHSCYLEAVTCLCKLQGHGKGSLILSFQMKIERKSSPKQRSESITRPCWIFLPRSRHSDEEEKESYRFCQSHSEFSLFNPHEEKHSTANSFQHFSVFLPWKWKFAEHCSCSRSAKQFIHLKLIEKNCIYCMYIIWLWCWNKLIICRSILMS